MTLWSLLGRSPLFFILEVLGRVKYSAVVTLITLVRDQYYLRTTRGTCKSEYPADVTLVTLVIPVGVQ